MTVKREMVFVVFLIHTLAVAWGKTPASTYSIFKASGIIDNYLVPHFESLHTLGVNYLIEDVTGYVEERGVKL